MRSSPATHVSCRIRDKPARVVKSLQRDPRKPTRQLRSVNKYFWYTSSDGTDRLVTSSGAVREPPRNIDDYLFDHTKFAPNEYPSTFPPGARWPPEKAQDLLCAMGPEGAECVGCAHFDATMCNDPWCKHTFERWSNAMSHWHDHFELRKTKDRGIGVYTKRAFRMNDVLGWYAGEIVPNAGDHLKNDYLMTMPVGISSDPDSPYPSDGDSDDSDDSYTEGPPPSSRRSSKTATTTYVSSEVCVMIDAQRAGNWTRFINHSCQPLAHFRMCRVGKMRVMVVRAARNIPAGVELTVGYGEKYYGRHTRHICHCGAKKCVSKDRKRKARRDVRQARQDAKEGFWA
jgi:hypothetical protein